MIDEKATVDKATEFLLKYHNIRRLAGQPIFSSIENAINTKVQLTKDDSIKKELVERKNTCINLLNAVHHTLSVLPYKDKNLLFEIYMSDSPKTGIKIYKELNISESTFYRLRYEAILKFSEAYRGADLIVFNSNT